MLPDKSLGFSGWVTNQVEFQLIVRRMHAEKLPHGYLIGATHAKYEDALRSLTRFQPIALIVLWLHSMFRVSPIYQNDRLAAECFPWEECALKATNLEMQEPQQLILCGIVPVALLLAYVRLLVRRDRVGRTMQHKDNGHDRAARREFEWYGNPGRDKSVWDLSIGSGTKTSTTMTWAVPVRRDTVRSPLPHFGDFMKRRSGISGQVLVIIFDGNS
jgi:hypothetical protein